MQEIKIDVLFTPEMIKKNKRKDIFIVLDVLRATSLINTLFAHGCSKIFVLNDIENAKKIKSQNGGLLAGERNGNPIPGFDIGNSPSEVEKINIKHSEIILTTTNGTKAIEKAADAKIVYIGSFLNALECSNQAFKSAVNYNCNIKVLCAGIQNRFSLEDSLCAGLFVRNIKELSEDKKVVLKLTDAAISAMLLYKNSPNIYDMFCISNSGKHLIQLGYKNDLIFCSQINKYKNLPILKKINKTICLS